MAERAAPLRKIDTQLFIFPINNGKLQDISCYISCTIEEVTKIHETPTLIYMKGPHYTFANSAYDIRVSGTDPRQVAQAYLNQLLETVRGYTPIKWQYSSRAVWGTK